MPSAKPDRTPTGAPIPDRGNATEASKKNKKTQARHSSSRIEKYTVEKFQTELDAVPADAWGRYHVYAYRTYPVINHELSGRKDKYIDKITQAVGPVRDYLSRVHGGGEYYLILDDQAKSTIGTAVCATVIDIPWHEAPPVLDVEELVLGDPANRGYEEFLRARGQHPEQESQMRAPYQQPQAAGSVSDIVKLVVPILEKALNKEISPAEKGYIEYLKNQAESAAQANDPTKLVTLLASLKDLIAPAATAGDSASKVAIDMLRDELKAMREANADLQKRLFDSIQKKDSPNLLGQIREIAGIVTAVKELLPRAPATAAVDSRTAMIQAISEAAQPILDSLPGVLQTWALARAQQAGIRVEPGVHFPMRAEVMPPSAEPAQGTGEEAAHAPNGTAGGPQMIPPQMLQLAAELGKMMFSAIEREIPGDEWARSFVDLNGLTMYRQVCGLGRERMLQILVSIPEFAPRVEMLGPVLVQFIDDFIAGPDGDDEEAPREEPAAPPPAAPSPAPRPVVTFRQPPASSTRESPGQAPTTSRIGPTAPGAPPPASPKRKASRARMTPAGAPPGGKPDGS